MASVELRAVRKVYPNGTIALAGLDLHVADGELLVLIGPSGSGKTTTLRLIAGLETATAGEVWIGGRAVNSLPPHRRQVAMVFQNHTLYPHLTVRRNIQFGLDLQSRPPLAGADPVEWAASMLELTPLLERRPSELSGGQQQRVALARALARRPDVFLLDEPLAHLDPRLRTETRRQLHLLQKRLAVTMVYVTHDPIEALSLGDRVVVLDHGIVQQAGLPWQLYQQPQNRTVANLVGWPGMNFLEGGIVRGSNGLLFAAEDAQLPVANDRWMQLERFVGERVTLGIRPEAILLEDADASDSAVQEAGQLRPIARALPPAPRGPEPETQLTMEVALVELTGSICLVTVRHNRWQVTTGISAAECYAADGGPRFQTGQKVRVSFRMQQASFFDSRNGASLTRSPVA